MTTVRAIDANGDWQWGHGKSSYKIGNDAVAQQIQCSVLSHLNDCFFDMGAGIDWFTLLGGKDSTALKLSISSTILGVTGVKAIKQISFNLNVSNRVFSVSYQVQTAYSKVPLTGTITKAA